jgi:maltooligosyltrehalose trehalohydrolase
VSYLENHDQVANTAFGRRLHKATSPSRLRAITAMMLLGPATPLLFQGQEFASSAPFLYFADHRAELREPIDSGRREFLSQFPSITDPEVQSALSSPVDAATYERSKLDFAERERHREWYVFHRDLLHLRREDAVLRHAGTVRPDGAVLTSEAFLLRYFGGAHGDRLLIVNLGCDLDLRPVPEPLLAAPEGSRWELQWSSESPRYGGGGTPPVRPHSLLHVPGESAVLLCSQPGPIEDDGREEDGKEADER